MAKEEIVSTSTLGKSRKIGFYITNTNNKDNLTSIVFEEEDE